MGDSGFKLKKTREEQGISIPRLSELTKIKPECLHALEEWRLSDLPSPAYTRGFIKIYCRYLQLDPGPILDDYVREFEASQPKIDIFQPAHADRIPLLPRFKLRTILAVAGGALLAAVLVLGGIRLLAGVSFTASADRGFRVLPDPYAPETLLRIPLPPGALGAESLVLEIRGKNDSWVEVSVDGALKYFNTLRTGAVYQAGAEKYFSLKLASPRDVEIFLNGRQVRLEQATPGPVTVKLDLETVAAR